VGATPKLAANVEREETGKVEEIEKVARTGTAVDANNEEEDEARSRSNHLSPNLVN